MGYALAEAALRRGARLLLITGPTSLKPPSAALVSLPLGLALKTAVAVSEPFMPLVVKPVPMENAVLLLLWKSKVPPSATSTTRGAPGA